MKRLPAAFFQSSAGVEPVRGWLRSSELSDEDRQRIGNDIRTVEYGWPIGMPTCRPLGGGLWEVRTSLDGRIARVLFCIAGGHMVLLHGFVKKSQRTPQGDLDLALRRKVMAERHK